LLSRHRLRSWLVPAPSRCSRRLVAVRVEFEAVHETAELPNSSNRRAEMINRSSSRPTDVALLDTRLNAVDITCGIIFRELAEATACPRIFAGA
jgi:hypothetical protein